MNQDFEGDILYMENKDSLTDMNFEVKMWVEQ